MEHAKQMAARAALAELPPSGTIGLGTGSTTKYFVEELAKRIAQGANYQGIPTSTETRRQAAALGIPLLSDDGPWEVDVTVDGADEVDEELNLIKGGGGALTREKIVNFASKRNIIIVDESKLSKQLGQKWRLPLEILRFGHAQTAKLLASIGTPTRRMKNGAPMDSDAGNCIYDLAAGTIGDPAALDARIRTIPGVVETGLFVARADVVIVATANEARRLERTKS